MSFEKDDKVAKETIEKKCESNLIGGVEWYDTEVVGMCSTLAWEIKYLRMRGLLIHHPMVPRLVRFKE
jgi:hypothetical protein